MYQSDIAEFFAEAQEARKIKAQRSQAEQLRRNRRKGAGIVWNWNSSTGF